MTSPPNDEDFLNSEELGLMCRFFLGGGVIDVDTAYQGLIERVSN